MRFAVIVAAAGLLLGACSSSSPGRQDQVASLSSATPSASATAVSGRPQLRLDTTDAEAQRFWDAYDDCLVAHGVKVNPVDQPGVVGNGPGRRLDQSGKPKSAYVACQGKLPLQPPEMDPDQNPNYAAQWNDDVKCLRAHGMMVHVTNPGEWTWDSDHSVIPDNQDELTKLCDKQAFGG